MNRVLTLLILALLGPLPVRGQTSDADPGPVPGRFALEPAAQWQGLDDRMASPVRYRGASAAVGASYTSGPGAWQWSVRATAAWPRMTSRLTTLDGGYEETFQASGGAELLRTVWDHGRFRGRVGPGLAGTSGVRRHVYGRDSWLNFSNAFVALQVVGRAELDLGRAGGLSETLALPVLGVAVRKEYASVTRREQTTTLAVPPSFLMIRHRLEYRVPGHRAVGARLFHETLVLRHREPLDLATVVQRLGVALEWRRRTP